MHRAVVSGMRFYAKQSYAEIKQSGEKNDKGRLLSITGFCATNILDRVPGGLDFLEVHDEIKAIDLHRTTSSRFRKC